MPTELESWLILNQISVIGPVKFKKLLDYFGNIEKVLLSSVSDLLQVEDINEKTANVIVAERKKIDVRKEIEEAAFNNVNIITSGMDEYPQVLKTIYDYPPVLYVKGQVKECDVVSVAVVGTRKITTYGKSVCEYLARELVNAGITVISGLARGIDTVAHTIAVEEKGRTIAVLGNGLSNCYPPENRKLEDRIAENGAVISEFSMHTKPDRQNFPRRNRLISGLSLGVIVVEADEKSGALITAKYAIEQGREVFAVPGSIFSKYSKGTHQLIKQGAKLVETIDDIISEINILKNFVERTNKNLKLVKQNKNLSEDAKLVFESISFEPVYIDLIAENTKIPFEKLSSVLLELIIGGFISELPGKMYIRKKYDN
ncbi:MAG: DNA-processing protein DprA [Elusimicrobia bacterium]|nr:DNA-processing protein DprA [Elusimicrobiota bacterium]